MDPTIIAAAIVTVLAAITGAAVTIINAAAAARDRKDSQVDRAALSETTKETAHKADVIIEKAAEIHTLTNSNLSRVTAALDVANEKIAGLEKLMAQIAKDRRVSDVPTIQGAAETILEGIEENTDAIKKNTQRKEK